MSTRPGSADRERRPAPSSGREIPTWLHAVLASACFLYLAADVYVTRAVRFPLPALFAGLLLLAGGRDVWRRFGHPRAWPAWAWWPLAFLLIAAVKNPLQSVAYAAVYVAVLLYFRGVVGPSPARYRRACRLFAVVLTASACVLVLSRIRPLAGIALRGMFLGHSELQVLQATGLATMVHIYGYQAAALGGIGLALAYDASDRARSRLVLGALLLAGASVVLLLSWQRSAALAVLAAAVALAVRKGAWPLLKTAAVLAPVVACLLLLPGAPALLDDTIVGKNQADIKKEWRLELQAETLEIIAAHPLGLVAEGKSWDYSLFRWGGALSRKGLSGHNAYLMQVAYFGWPVALLLLLILARTVTGALRHGFGCGRTEAGVWPLAMSCALIALFVNALLHNSSLFNAEGSTLFTYVAVWHWIDLRTGTHA